MISDDRRSSQKVALLFVAESVEVEVAWEFEPAED